MTDFVRAIDLRTDARDTPLALEETPRRLSWRLEGGRAIARIEVRAAASPADLQSGADLIWATEVADVSPLGIAWSGPPLLRGDEVWWSVRLSDASGQGGDWADPAYFRLAPPNLEAAWITHPAWSSGSASGYSLPEVRKTFTIDRTPQAATMYVTALGVHNTSINGELVGGAMLEPGYASVGKRVPIVGFDILGLLQQGENVVAATIGTGMTWLESLPGYYTKFVSTRVAPRYLAQIVLRYEEGDAQVIATDEGWESRLGTTTLAHWYAGEHADLRISRPWEPAATVGTADAHGPLWWRAGRPVRAQETLTPIDRVSAGDRFVLDFGTNIAGRIRLDLRESEEGAQIVMRPAEILDSRGQVDQITTGTPIWDSLISGGREAVWSPSLTYHGFRYVEVSGISPRERLESIQAQVLRADLEKVGAFSCSDPLLNQLHTIIDRAVQSNSYSVFTDCPHREKLGWLEQNYLCFQTLSRGYDVAAHLRDSLTHARDSQTPDGLVPSIAPEFVVFDTDSWHGDPTAFRDDPNWGGAIVMLPWELYRCYGDTQPLKENWYAGLSYIEYLRHRMHDDVLDHGLGDWIAIDETTPRAMVATFGFVRILETAIRVAAVLGDQYQGRKLKKQLGRTRTEFVSRFSGDDGQRWGSGSQGSIAIALDLDLVPNAQVARVVESLVRSISDTGYKVSVGENTLPSLLRCLTRFGYDELIYQMVAQTDGPGYGHQLAVGATALTESWQGPSAMRGQVSQNHFMLGVIDEWLTGDVAGLRQAPESVNWRRVTVKPALLEHLEFASTEFNSPAGAISVRWERESAGGFSVQLSLPPGVSGTVEVGSKAVDVRAGEVELRFPPSNAQARD